MRTWQFMTIVLLAIAMSASLAHLLEMVPKRTLEPQLYVRLHRTLYPNFGRIAGTAEILAVVSVVALAWTTRGSGPFSLTLTSAVCLTLAHVVFWMVVYPANRTMGGWSLDAIPADWMRWRDRWEFAHAVRAGLILAGFAALVRSAMR